MAGREGYRHEAGRDARDFFTLFFWLTHTGPSGTIQPMTEIHMPTWGEIETACKAKGLSVAAMCRRADIDQAAFSRWKSGNGTPSGRTIQKMIDAIEREPVSAKGVA